MAGLQPPGVDHQARVHMALTSTMSAFDARKEWWLM